MARWPVVLLVLLCAELDLQSSPALLGACAQDAPAPANVDSEGGDVPADGEAAPEAGLASMVDSMAELQQKLGQLKKLVDDRTGDDPAMKERMEGLMKQLEGLGLGDLASQGKAASEKDRKAEVQVMTACLSLSLQSAFPTRRSSSLSTLKRMASGKMTKEEASGLPVMRMVAVCIKDLSNDEFKKFTHGKLTSLPDALKAKAALPESKEQVLKLEEDIPSIWEEMLATVAAPMEIAAQEAADKEPKPPVPSSYGLLALVPLLLIAAFLGKKFLDMQNAQRSREEQKKGKAAKKNK